MWKIKGKYWKVENLKKGKLGNKYQKNAKNSEKYQRIE